MVRTCTSLSESMFSSTVAVVSGSGPDFGLISPLFGIVGGSCSCAVWVMLLMKGSVRARIKPYVMFGLALAAREEE